MNATPQTGSPVYLSGPMFSAADLWQQAQIAAVMQAAGHTTYLPQRDGIEVGSVMGGVNGNDNLTPAQALEVMTFVRMIVFALDVYQLIARCQSLVFNMDGRAPDDGSLVEVAAGFTAGKPIVVFKTTPISELGGFDNPMIQGLSTNWSYVHDVAALPAAVAAAVKQTAALGARHLRRARIWRQW